MIVYCVLCDDGGGSFLEKIFQNAFDAASYIDVQPQRYRYMYHIEEWDVE
jgi:hypothetical protein